MAVSIRELLNSTNLSSGKVIAGDSGLDREASSVTVGEVPDIGEWLSGGEIVLSTFYATPSDKLARLNFVSSIIDSHATALIAKPGRYIPDIDLEIIEIANKHDFPVIEIPSDVRWTHLIQEISERIQGSQALELRRSAEIHERLLQVVLEGGDLDRICEVSSYLQSCPVAIVDPFGFASATSSGNTDEFSALFADTIAGVGRGDQKRQRLRLDMAEGHHLHYQPIVAGSDYLGSVVSVHQSSQAGVLDERALEHTSTVAAIEIARQRLLLETEIRLGGDFLDDLMDAHHEASDLQRRAALLGFDLTKEGLTLALSFDPSVGKQTGEDSLTIALRAARRLLDELSQGSLATVKRDTVLALIPVPETTEEGGAIEWAKSITVRLRQEISWRSPDTADLRVGIGGVYVNPETLRTSINEAQTAVQISRRLRIDPGGATAFKDVGAYRLLLRFMESDPDEFEALYQDSLGKLAEYDEKRDSNLLDTLETYFEMNESVSLTAEKLFTHRHTIRYRLDRIKELSGLDINNSEGRETLSLAVKAGHLIKGAR